MTTRVGVLEGVEVRGAAITGLVNVLTPEALGFVARLHREFNPTRESLLKRRAQRQAQLDSGVLPDFLPETEFVRRGEWRGLRQYRSLHGKRLHRRPALQCQR